MDLEMWLDAAANVRNHHHVALEPRSLEVPGKMSFGTRYCCFLWCILGPPFVVRLSSLWESVSLFVFRLQNGLGAAANVRITIVGRACRKLHSLRVLESWVKNALKNTAIVTCCFAWLCKAGTHKYTQSPCDAFWVFCFQWCLLSLFLGELCHCLHFATKSVGFYCLIWEWLCWNSPVAGFSV